MGSTTANDLPEMVTAHTDACFNHTADQNSRLHVARGGGKINGSRVADVLSQPSPGHPGSRAGGGRYAPVRGT